MQQPPWPRRAGALALLDTLDGSPVMRAVGNRSTLDGTPTLGPWSPLSGRQFSAGRRSQFARIEIAIAIAVEPVELLAQVALECLQRDRLATAPGELIARNHAVTVPVHPIEATAHVGHVLRCTDLAVAIAVELP
jgi:hypothetical protein